MLNYKCSSVQYTWHHNITRAHLSLTHERSKVNTLRIGDMLTDLCTIVIVVVEPVMVAEEEMEQTTQSEEVNSWIFSVEQLIQ